MTAQPTQAGTVLSYQEHFVGLDLPQFRHPRLRLYVAAVFGSVLHCWLLRDWEWLGSDEPWTGIDADAEPWAWREARRYNQYDLVFPNFWADARIELAPNIEAIFGAKATRSTVATYRASQLALEEVSGNPYLVGMEPNVVLQEQVGLLFDSRDDERWTQQGMAHEVSFRGGPVLGLDDGLWGIQRHGPCLRAGPPRTHRRGGPGHLRCPRGRTSIHLLAEYGGLKGGVGPGGKLSLRGIGERRYHGPIKAIGNLELRTRFFEVRILEHDAAAGVVGFVVCGPGLVRTCLGWHRTLAQDWRRRRVSRVFR